MYPWWTSQQAGLIGAIGGTAFGLFGAVFGTVAGLCAPRGKCKRTIFAMTGVLITIGVGGLGAGLAALALHQPYAVWYPLVLGGGMGTLLSCFVTPTVVIHYRQADNRRLEAEQLRRG